MRLLVVLTVALTSMMSVYGYQISPITDDMQSAADAVISELLPAGGVTTASSVAWTRLAYICDTFGPRFSGSAALETALSYIRDLATADGLRVTEQNTTVPRWVRGEEWATMLSPRVKKLHMVGLGMSNSTMGRNITANVIVFSGYDDMMAGDNCTRTQGKIVLFNTIFTTYGGTVNTRTNAAVWGAECGAVAALIRSIGPFSMQNPHTGYSVPGVIAAAAVSNEDASQLQRMQDRGQELVVSLYMENTVYEDSPSRNLLIDLVGSELPDEYVLVSGHGDSWDIAEGAMDDGGGFMASWEAVRTLNNLGLKPKRTIRAVVWVNEENGDRGGLQYLADGEASDTLVNHSIAIETDGGVFEPLGLGVTCDTGDCGAAMAQLEALSPLLAPIGGGGRVISGGGGADIDPICQTGLVCAGFEVLDPRLSNGVTNNPCTNDAQGKWLAPAYDTAEATSYDSGYFWFHHSEADTMDLIDPAQLNANAAALAVWIYSIAQLPELLPRDAAAPEAAGGSDGNTNQSEVDISVAVALAVLGCMLVGVWYSYSSHSSSEDSGDAEMGVNKGKLYEPLNSGSDNA